MINSHPPRILVSLQTEIAYGRGVSRGVIAYARQQTNWRLSRSLHPSADEVFSTESKGLICQDINPADYLQLQQAGIPVVLVGRANANPNIDAVVVDEDAVGAIAADHFIELGLRNFAYVASGNWLFVHLRLAGLNAALAARALGPASSFIESLYDEHMRLRFETMLEQWLPRLPRPCAVLAANDAVGIEVVAAARRAGLRVPDDLTVVGVDDDDLFCEMSDVPLSSVAQPTFAIGFEAARVLQERIEKPDRPRAVVELAPIRVVTRASSDLVALDDEDVAMAVRLIRDHAAEPITVEWIVKQIPVARRSLERRFRNTIGRSMLEQVHRVRFERARQLLAETDLGLKAVAKQSGFGNARWLAKSFQKQLRQSPSDFRKRYRTRP